MLSFIKSLVILVLVTLIAFVLGAFTGVLAMSYEPDDDIETTDITGEEYHRTEG